MIAIRLNAFGASIQISFRISAVGMNSFSKAVARHPESVADQPNTKLLRLDGFGDHFVNKTELVLGREFSEIILRLVGVADAKEALGVLGDLPVCFLLGHLWRRFRASSFSSSD
jgi:hypothetical protein